MKIERLKLLEALKIVEPGLASREIFEQTNDFAFIKGQVITYNNEVSISHPVEGLDNIQGTVRADKLYQLLGKLETD